MKGNITGRERILSGALALHYFLQYAPVTTIAWSTPNFLAHSNFHHHLLSTPTDLFFPSPPQTMTNHGRPAPLQRAHAHCPITALAVLRLAPEEDGEGEGDCDGSGKLCILSGEDTHLRIRDAATGRLRASVHVFAAQPVQGIGATLGADDHVLVWGGPWVAVISRARIRRLLAGGSRGAGPQPAPSLALSRGEVLRAPDWIYHASLSAASPGSLAAVVTAHNEVIPLHIITTATRRLEEGEGEEGEGWSLRWGRVRAPPSSRPILYSAQVRWVGEEHVLVAAGTAFGEIVVWRCRVAEGEGEGEVEGEDEDEVEVLHVLLGHEGSIFGVDISPEIQLPEDASSSSSSSSSPGRRKRTTPAARFLASCSDDRTIRVWDISEAASRDGSAAPAEGGVERRRRRRRLEKEEEKKKSFPEARETGFGEDIPSGLDNLASHVSSRPLAMAMGHMSRIWGVRFAPPRPDAPAERLALYSFGEDATAQRWRLDLDGLHLPAQCEGAKEECGAAPVAGLAHEAIIHRHSGKHIWSSAVAGLWRGAGRILVVTGGSDGKINVVEEAASPEEDVRAVMLDISSSDVVSRFPASRPEPGDQDAGASVDDAGPCTKPAKRKKACLGEERFLMYALLSDGTIIATTVAGRVFRGSLRGRDVSWTEMRLSKPHQDDLQQYQIVRSIGASTALLGSTSGNLYMCHGESVRQIYKAPGKIADIFPLPPLESLQGLATQQSDSSSSTTTVIVSTMGSSQVRLLVLDAASEDTIQRECAIELEKGFMITSAGCCQGYLIFGSRTGALLIYKHTTTPGGRDGYESIARIDRPSTKDAVSCIIPLPAKAGVPSPYFLTTSRDGRYRIYEITPGVTTDEIHTHLRHEALPPLGPVIESAFFFTPPPPFTCSDSSPAAPPPPPLPSPELILAGFRGGSFVVWNETRQLELASVACGSGHRSFTCRADPRRPDHLACVWTRAARTCVYAQRGLAQTPVKRGGHGREVKAVAVAAASGARGGAVVLLATGAEDTTVRIWRYHRRDGDADTDMDTDTRDDDPLRCLAVVERHTTGIQCLGWAAGGRYLVSSGGNEELFVWRTTRLDRSDYEGLAVVCEGVYPDKTRDGDLRIMGFDVEVLEEGRAGEAGKEGEEEEEEEVLCLSLVLSNSTLKTYRYARTAGFTLLAEGRYTGACLTQIRHLRVTDGAAEVHVLTASTDGCIALWKASSPAETMTEQQQQQQQHVLVDAARLHQSSIKALDLCALPRHPTHHHHTSSSSPFPDSYALLTGGDDDALGHTRLTWSDTPGGGFRLSAPPTSLTLARGAHAAAVTGLRITSLEEVEGDGASVGSNGGGYRVRLCTASNDQRVRTWRVEVGTGGAVRRVALTGERYSGVADCGDLERLVDGGGGGGPPGVVVVGVGVEVWEGV